MITLYNVGRYQEAIENADRALALSPDDTFALSLMSFKDVVDLI